MERGVMPSGCRPVGSVPANDEAVPLSVLSVSHAGPAQGGVVPASVLHLSSIAYPVRQDGQGGSTGAPCPVRRGVPRRTPTRPTERPWWPKARYVRRQRPINGALADCPAP